MLPCRGEHGPVRAKRRWSVHSASGELTTMRQRLRERPSRSTDSFCGWLFLSYETPHDRSGNLAALPPDVRKGSAFPWRYLFLKSRGYVSRPRDRLLKYFRLLTVS